MAHSARRSHRRRSPYGRFIPVLAVPMIASVAVVALTLMLIGTELAGSVMVRAAINPTPTPEIRINRTFIPIELPTEVPTRDVPVLGIPTETPVTEEVVPTEEVFPTEEMIPTDEPTVEPTVEARRHVPEEGISVSIWKRNCPEGTTSDLTGGDYAGICQGIGQGIEFSLTGGAGEVVAVTDDEGETGWHGLTSDASGELFIRETIPEGYGFPVVFCGQTESDILTPAETEKVDAGGGTISLIPVSASSAFSCWWYNIPAEDPADDGNTIQLWKYYCPEGTDYGMDQAAYESACSLVQPTDFTLVDGGGFHVRTTNGTGSIAWPNVVIGQEGELQLIEDVPVGYGDPVVFCGNEGETGVLMPSVSGFVVPMPTTSPFVYHCTWYNVPTGSGGGGDVTIFKHTCPAGTAKTDDFYALGETCLEQIDPVEFTITATGGGYSETKTADPGVTQTAVFTDVPFGEIAIEETVPDGYSWPLVFCSDTPADGPGNYVPVSPSPESGSFILDHRADAEIPLACLVFNFPTDETSSLSIVKYTCPEGYDLYAPGANPGFDCQTLTDGIPFVLDDGMPGLDLGGITGDGGTGVVTFADVEPGSYTVHELLSPGMGEPFVLNCEGGAVPQLQPYPLWSGNDLPITLMPGEAVFCFWYNVPAGDPDLGTLTVTKYACTTETFVSTVDCQVYEGGQVIQLLEWDSTQWDMVDVEQTDAFGRIVWTNLPIGHYLLAEPDTTWCHIESSALLGNDGSFNLNLQGGMDQTVDLYNCGFDPEIPEGTPTDWPNTGVGTTYSSPRGDTADDRRIPPVEGGEPATPTANRCLAADDPLATSGDAACPRGAVPSTIRIDAIGVNAPIEVKETVGGQMQQPTGETAVAWYKESPRLGESGNMLFAGHLNWWGIPEAVFFNLGDLQEGDEIVVVDASGNEWTYRVTWVRQDDTFAPPAADVVGPTDAPSITLITCGGAWNADTGLYDKRTVVRAELVRGPGMD